MKLRHSLYPSPQVNTRAGEARFSDYHFETEDEDLASALLESEEIVEVEEEEPKKTAKPSAKTKKDAAPPDPEA